MAYRIAILPLLAEARADQAPVGLEAITEEMPGVREVSVDPIGQTVRFVYDDAQTNLLEAQQLLAQHGYPTGTPITTEGKL